MIAPVSPRGEVLVAILNKQLDFAIVREQQWYRIPIGSAEKWLGKRWPPKWIAFYHTKVFGSLAFGIHYYARILNIRQAYRWQLFPNEPQGERSNRRYYKLILETLRPLPQPILSRRWRRIVFIPTTWDKFMHAAEINDLYDESPLEDRLWAEFKRLKIQAERQEYIRVNDTDYALDFAIYCAKGNIDVETDGDFWHANPERAAVDNLRNNALETVGWSVIRFSTPQIQDGLAEYCIPKVLENINRLGGLEEGKLLPRRFDLDQMDVSRQLSLFDEPDQSNTDAK